MNNKLMNGKAYWRSLDQLAETEEFKQFLYREFPENASELNNPLSRRKFLTLMGASIGLAGLAGCRRPVEKIIPYVVAPENIIPGIPNYYATTMPFGLNSYGLVAESHEGRPTKLEGNEKHPSTRGKASAMIQAQILGLYDPDRGQMVTHDGKTSNWTEFVTAWRSQLSGFEQNGGEGLMVISESFASPSLAALRSEFLKKFPKAEWLAFEPVSDENILNGLKKVFGSDVRPLYEMEKAKVIFALDSDFALTETESIIATRGFAAGRRMNSEQDEMNRLYVVENTYTTTGTLADHRLRLPFKRIPAFLVALTKKLQAKGLQVSLNSAIDGINSSAFDEKWLEALAGDLLKNRGASLLLAGHRQEPFVHALTAAINTALGNDGKTVHYKPLSDALLPDMAAFSSAVRQMQERKVKALALLGVNPVYAAPADLNFGEALKSVEFTVQLGLYPDETGSVTRWYVPQAHFLESWADARSADGTVSFVQPMIEPLLGGKSNLEMAQALISGEDKTGYEILRGYWQSKWSALTFESEWRRGLHDGLVSGSALPDYEVKVQSEAVAELGGSFKPKASELSKTNLELVFQVDPAVFDGRFGNNGWLQEMPDPVTKIAWDNVLIISPRTAGELNLANEELVRLSVSGLDMVAPVWVVPGQADYSLTLALGYGRRGVGRIADGVGFDAYRLRRSDALWSTEGVTLARTGETYKLASTQDHGSMEGRPLAREAGLEHYREHPHFAPEMVEHPPLKNLWKEHTYDEGYQWGMTIDLNSCTGCNACLVACQSENNISIVGKEQVSRGREMHWIRLDRYFSGDPDDPEVIFQPVACQQCENAPCEQVCPVAATVHDAEGLNVMAYNRCIGTRYCSNNCPYKVRRFNFFNNTKDYPELIKMAQNPDVTVRARGVMEKCTYCTQRINEARIRSQNENRQIYDGEVVAACQQTCPAEAIVFGNLLDPESAVSKAKRNNRNYSMLGELNLRTRTTFMARIRNPHPDLAA